MIETSVRLLRLLSLLQAGRDWSGADLGARLGVTTRTIRNDVERLRILGYEVSSRAGPAGGYRLAAGVSLPPLLFDDDEAVAVVVGLRAAAAGTVTGIEGRRCGRWPSLSRRCRLGCVTASTPCAPQRSPRPDAARKSTRTP